MFFSSVIHVCSFRFNIQVQCRRYASWNVMFFGSDQFSLQSLKAIHENLGQEKLVQRLEVVTSSSSKQNSVYQFSERNNLKVHVWPLNVLDPEFHLGVVVSFGHLIPKSVIQHFPLGIINVHASLLPRWRGAAPIMHAIMSGDSETGISIMRIKPHHFDTGEIILQKTCSIGADEVLPSLYSRLSVMGAECMIETLSTLPHCLEKAVLQPDEGVTLAPRVFKDSAAIRWKDQSATEIYNLHRGLYGIAELSTKWHSLPLKLVGLAPPAARDPASEEAKPGDVRYSAKSRELRVLCAKNDWLCVSGLKLKGKLIQSRDFFNGYMSRIPRERWFFQ